MWPQTLAIPGFLGGAVFSVVLWIANGRRRFDELSLSRFGALGAVTGLLLGALVVAAGAGSGALPLGLRAVVIIAPVTLMSALSAAGSLALARMAKEQALPDPGADVADVELTGGEARERLGGEG